MTAITRQPGMFESLPYRGTGDDTLGDWWNAVGQIGGSAAVWGLNSLFGPPNPNTGCLRTRLSSNDSITRCVATVMQMFDQVEAMIGLADPAAIVAQAEQIVGHLHNDNFFKQTVSGSAGTTLANAKRRARERADAIRARVTPQPVPVQTVTDPATGQPVPATAGGIDNSTTKVVLIGAGALALLMLLRG